MPTMNVNTLWFPRIVWTLSVNEINNFSLRLLQTMEKRNSVPQIQLCFEREMNKILINSKNELCLDIGNQRMSMVKTFFQNS